jgi:hypothetical protein
MDIYIHIHANILMYISVYTYVSIYKYLLHVASESIQSLGTFIREEKNPPMDFGL